MNIFEYVHKIARGKNRDYCVRASVTDAIIGKLFDKTSYETFDGLDIAIDQLGDFVDCLGEYGKVPVARHVIRVMSAWANMKARQTNPKKEKPIRISAYGDAARVVSAFLDNRCKLNSFVVLMHGVPGTGKSYFPTLFGGYHTVDLREIEISAGMDDDGDKKAAWEIASSITVINEIDRLTPSGITILQAELDKIRASQGKKLVVLTTNHFELLKDLPLVRPSRVDYIQEVGMIVEDDAKLICESYAVPWIKSEFVGEMSVAAVTQYARQALLEKIIRGEFDGGESFDAHETVKLPMARSLHDIIFKSHL